MARQQTQGRNGFLYPILYFLISTAVMGYVVFGIIPKYTAKATEDGTRAVEALKFGQYGLAFRPSEQCKSWFDEQRRNQSSMEKMLAPGVAEHCLYSSNAQFDTPHQSSAHLNALITAWNSRIVDSPACANYKQWALEIAADTSAVPKTQTEALKKLYADAKGKNCLL